jgi:hypothetical protein
MFSRLKRSGPQGRSPVLKLPKAVVLKPPEVAIFKMILISK